MRVAPGRGATRTPDGATGASEVQLDRASCTLGGATRPCELHLRDSMTPRDYLGPPFLPWCTCATCMVLSNSYTATGPPNSFRFAPVINASTSGSIPDTSLQMPRAASRRAPGIDGVPSLSEAALRRLEREDDEHEHTLPQSLASDGSGVACDPQGLAGALACLTA